MRHGRYSGRRHRCGTQSYNARRVIEEYWCAAWWGNQRSNGADRLVVWLEGLNEHRIAPDYVASKRHWVYHQAIRDGKTSHCNRQSITTSYLRSYGACIKRLSFHPPSRRFEDLRDDIQDKNKPPCLAWKIDCILQTSSLKQSTGIWIIWARRFDITKRGRLCLKKTENAILWKCYNHHLLSLHSLSNSIIHGGN